MILFGLLCYIYLHKELAKSVISESLSEKQYPYMYSFLQQYRICEQYRCGVIKKHYNVIQYAS